MLHRQGSVRREDSKKSAEASMEPALLMQGPSTLCLCKNLVRLCFKQAFVTRLTENGKRADRQVGTVLATPTLHCPCAHWGAGIQSLQGPYME